MRAEIESQVAELRQRAQAATAELSDVSSILANLKEEGYLSDLLKQVSSWTHEIETDFIAVLKEERRPPRTLAEERAIVVSAEVQLSLMIAPALQRIREFIDRHGSDAKAAGR